MKRSDGRGHLPYMPGLDGLRAFAVVAVVLYHADISWMPAGFLGVDIFFVISGFLITALLLSEHGSHGRIRVWRFWARRALRLLPALFLLLGVTMGVAVLFLPDEVDRLRGDVVAGFLYFTNWDLIARETSYFEAFGRPPILRHLWSLAIEEQFYIVWPVLLGVGLKFLSRRLLLGLTVAGVVASTAWMWLLFDPFEDPSRLYFGTDTRLAGLLVGATLAFLWQPGREVPARARLPLDFVGMGALAALAGLTLASDEFAPFLYKGGFLLVAVITALAIVAAVQPRGLLGRGLGWFPIRWIGLRSYAIYLWHWPIFVVTRPQDVGLDGVELFVLRVGVTLAAAELSFRFVERPVRQGALVRWSRMLRSSSQRQAQRAATGAVALAGVVVVLIVAFTVVSVPTRLDQTIANQIVPLEVPIEEEAGARLFGSDGAAEPGTSDRTSDRTSESASESAAATTAAPTAGETPIDGAADPTSLTDPVGGTPEVAATRQESSVGLAAPALAVASRSEEGVTDEADEQQPIVVAPVLAIGDSVMFGARNILLETFDSEIAVNTAISRSFADAIPLMQTLRDLGLIPETLVVHLGTNNPVYEEQFEAMMEILRDVPRVVFVTVRVPQRWEGISNQTLRDGVRRWPNTSLVDWHEVAGDADYLFAEDGVHLQVTGAQLYSRLIREGVEMATGRAATRELSSPATSASP
jgi:peptidoglycan/LPS O-acetylase OafA/YrhL